MDNERLILMLDALRLEIRNATLQVITANAITQGAITSERVDAATQESAALQQRSDNAANTALGHSS